VSREPETQPSRDLCVLERVKVKVSLPVRERDRFGRFFVLQQTET